MVRFRSGSLCESGRRLSVQSSFGRSVFYLVLLCLVGAVVSSGFCSVYVPVLRCAWCERGDSNPHTFRYQILSLARLPIPPLSHFNHLRGSAWSVSSSLVRPYI